MNTPLLPDCVEVPEIARPQVFNWHLPQSASKQTQTPPPTTGFQIGFNLGAWLDQHQTADYFVVHIGAKTERAY
jgi:hypothetical protein